MPHFKKRSSAYKHTYKKIPGWFYFQNQYDFVLDQLPVNANVVEVGSYLGKSLSYLVVEGLQRKLNLNVSSIDLWGLSDADAQYDNENYFHKVENIYQQFLENTKVINNHIRRYRMVSWEGAKLFPDESLDYVFIDAGHDYESVYKDLVAWYPKIKKQGYFGGDDYSLKDLTGVKTALDQFCKENNISYELMPSTKKSRTPKSLQTDKNWIMRKY